MIDSAPGMRQAIWTPQNGPQRVVCSLEEGALDVIMVGGARGGGKTDLILGEWLYHAHLHGANARGLVIRREYIQLDSMIDRARKLYEPLGARFAGLPVTCYMPNGAKLMFRNVWNQADAVKFQGHQYTRLYIEEWTNWPDLAAVDTLLATLRSAEGVPCMAMGTCNPGGPGHLQVKGRFIDPAPRGYKTLLDPEYGYKMAFVPMLLEDNPALVENDPAYEQRIMAAAGSPEMAKAWRWGVWDVIVGGFFTDVFDRRYNVLPHFEPPASWPRILGFDWGSARPSAAYWAAIAQGETLRLGGVDRYLPKGSVVLYRELYTVEKNRLGLSMPNKGLRWSNERLGRVLVEMTGEEDVQRIADPSIFTRAGGPSIYDQMCQGAGENLRMGHADTNRIAGAALLRKYFEAGSRPMPEEPGLYVMDNCIEFIRTVPVMERDRRIHDDVDTETEDHAYDAVRYLLMAATGRRQAHKVELLGF